MKISSEDEEFFSTNGYLVVRNLIEPEMAGEILKETVDLARGDRWHPGWNPGGLNVLQQLGYFTSFLDSILVSTFLSKVQAVAQQLLGQNVVLWGDQMIMKPGGCDVQVVWHQDAAYWCNWSVEPNLPPGHCLNDQDRAITCWLALCDVSSDMAPVCYLPGSHKYRFPHGEVTAPTDAYNQTDSLFAEPDSLAPYLDRLVHCPLDAGDCTFHDARTVHCSGSNTSALPRYGLALHFWPVSGWDRAAREADRKIFSENTASVEKISMQS